VEAFKIALKALTKAVCLRAEEAITWWRQLLPSGIRQGFIPYPNPDLDFDRQAVSGLLSGLHSGMVLYRFSELEPVIDAAANDPELVAVDAGGLIQGKGKAKFPYQDTDWSQRATL
jgi:hypothetical protein